jgi:hypothetical protein
MTLVLKTNKLIPGPVDGRVPVAGHGYITPLQVTALYNGLKMSTDFYFTQSGISLGALGYGELAMSKLPHYLFCDWIKMGITPMFQFRACNPTENLLDAHIPAVVNQNNWVAIEVLLDTPCAVDFSKVALRLGILVQWVLSEEVIDFGRFGWARTRNGYLILLHPETELGMLQFILNRLKEYGQNLEVQEKRTVFGVRIRFAFANEFCVGEEGEYKPFLINKDNQEICFCESVEKRNELLREAVESGKEYPFAGSGDLAFYVPLTEDEAQEVTQ